MTDDSRPKTLKDLKKEIPSTDDIMRRLAMAQLASDYEASMLSASLLEYMLVQAITTKFIPLGKDHLNSLFSDAGNAPLCTFAAKIKLAYALGIISIETRCQIERVKEVRNHFAHHKDRASFDEAIVRSECIKFKQYKAIPDNLKKVREPGLTPKLMYVQTCSFVCIDLVNYINSTGTLGDTRQPVDCF
jgi:hypothetical protein